MPKRATARLYQLVTDALMMANFRRETMTISKVIAAIRKYELEQYRKGSK